MTGSISSFSFAQSPAPMTGGSCTNCAKLDITSYSSGLGDLTRDADASFQSWGSGSVNLTCDDGTSGDSVDLGLEPYDLEGGIDLEDQSLPNVDLTSSSLTCIVEVDDGLQSATIDVDIL